MINKRSFESFMCLDLVLEQVGMVGVEMAQSKPLAIGYHVQLSYQACIR